MQFMVLLSFSSTTRDARTYFPHGRVRRCPPSFRLSARASVGPLADGSIVDHLSAQDDDDSVRNDSDDCTAGARFVLEGVDLVAYFSLAEGDEPVLGSSRHVSTYGNFTFQFSSERNKALFEARTVPTRVGGLGHENREEIVSVLTPSIVLSSKSLARAARELGAPRGENDRLLWVGGQSAGRERSVYSPWKMRGQRGPPDEATFLPTPPLARGDAYCKPCGATKKKINFQPEHVHLSVYVYPAALD